MSGRKGNDLGITFPTLSNLGGCKSTVGAGLPSFAGRATGDLHYNLTDGKEYVLTGAAGSAAYSDTFTRNTLNSADSGQVYATNGGAPIVNGTQAVRGASDGSALVNLGASPVSYELTADCILGDYIYLYPRAGDATLASNYNVTFRRNGNFASIGLLKNGAFQNEQIVTGVSSVGDLHRVIITITNSGTAVVITARVRNITTAGAEQTFTLLNSASGNILTGNFVGFGFANAGGGQALNSIDGVDVGSLAWTYNDPIYVQAQLVSGVVAVANHVLKPGVRVPAQTTLRQMVLRIDTAPVGSSLTVQAERFNNGASQGIIATASIPTGLTVGSVTGLSAACAVGDIIKFNVTAVGSTTAGSDLTASLDFF